MPVTSDWTRMSISRVFRRAAEQQGGLLNGSDPTKYNTHDPIRLFIVQLGVIMLMTQLLSLFLGRIRQPKVIAEVLGGIILGPTAMGRIPGFTEHVFPDPSRPFLALVANIGLVLFLFLVGLEIDVAVIKRNAKTSMTISAGGMILPFGLGAAVAIPVYRHFIDPEAASFGHFLLFVGVAYSITAFPVLCRILVALELLDTTVGIVVLSAGVGNDVVGWTLLALTVALVNASTGLTALYVLLCAVGWALFILYPVKRGMLWFARWTGSVESGPSPLFMTVTILLVFGSAFFTDIIGVHAIFGGFLAGLAIPHEGGLAIALTEKLEDMVSIIFLPLYFTLSGLSTNLGLLDNGLTWGFTILICVTAYIGKFCGGSLAAKFAGFSTRESATIGTLMSCKGLVELIVLNVGLSAGILSTRVFSMFVLEALVLTFATTPVTLWLYPLKHRVRATAVGGNFGHA
ncbi:K(+)/H(+) antiporter, partial [Ceratobasidium sp. 423]